MFRSRNFPFLSAPTDSAEGGGGVAAEDTTALKAALAAERKRGDSAEKRLRDLEGQQELANKTLAEQVATLQTQLAQSQSQFEVERQQLTGQLTQRDIRSAFVTAYGGSKGLPEYADVLYAHVGGSLQLADGKVVTSDGKSLDQAIAQAREKFPAMFAPDNVAAGSGLSASTAIANPGARVVSAANLKGVSAEDLVSGKVILDLNG
jgi:hypothetical protein